MKSVFALALLVASAAAQGFQVSTPVGASGAIQCAVYQINWTGGSGPFDVRLFDPSANLVEEISASAQSSPVQWTVNQPAGQQFSFAVRDSTGATAQSAPFIIQGSSNSGCLNGGSASSGASSATAPGGAAPSGSSTPAPSGSSAPSQSAQASRSGSSAASPSQSASGGSSGNSSGAQSTAIHAGVIGAAFAAAAAALF